MQILFPVSLLTAFAAGTVFAAPAQVTFTLAQHGKPAATIVIAKQPTRVAQFAAYELQWHLKQIADADFLIVKEDQPVKGSAIRVNTEPLRFGWLGSYGHFNGWVREPLLPTVERMLRHADQRSEVSGGQAAAQPGIEDQQPLFGRHGRLRRFLGPDQPSPMAFGASYQSRLVQRFLERFFRERRFLSRGVVGDAGLS
jgi:hypothetical protein